MNRTSRSSIMAAVAALAAAIPCGTAFAQIGKGSMSKSPFDQAAQPADGNEVVDICWSYLPKIPGGETPGLAFTFTIDPGWHLYWKNNGDTGMPIMIDLDLPDGVEAGEILWPTPKRYEHSGGLLDYIYETEATLVVPIHRAGSPLPPEAGPLGAASIEFLVCQEACIPGERTIEITAPRAGFRTEPSPTIDAARFPVSPGDGACWHWEGATLVITSKEAESMTFFPEAGENIRPVNALRDGVAQGDTLRFAYRDAVRNASIVRGVLEVRNRSGQTAFYQVQAPAPE